MHETTSFGQHRPIPAYLDQTRLYKVKANRSTTRPSPPIGIAENNISVGGNGRVVPIGAGPGTFGVA
jgi:hypothetical protein